MPRCRPCCPTDRQGSTRRVHSSRPRCARPPPPRPEARLGLVVGDRHVDVHRVAQRLRRIQVLHPDRGALAERVDAVVVVHRRVAEDRAPEAEVDRIGLGGNGQLHLLHRAAVRDRATLPRHRRDRLRDRDMPRLGAPHLARQLHREPIRRDGQQRPLLEAGHLRHRRGQARRSDERVDPEDRRGTAVEDRPVIDAVSREELAPALFAHAWMLAARVGRTWQPFGP